MLLLLSFFRRSLHKMFIYLIYAGCASPASPSKFMVVSTVGLGVTGSSVSQ